MLFVSSSHIRSSSFFARISGSESGSLVSSSFDLTVHKVFGSFILDDNDNISLKIPSQSSGANSDLSALIVTSSNGRLRVGVGTTNPKSVFDFKDIEDSSIGAELLVRSARSTQGALTGDEGGSINFIIDSGSFNDIKTSGSLAKIKTNVNSVGNTGVQGKLVFELSKGASDFQDVFSYGFSQISDTDFGLFSQIQTASLLLRDFSAGGKSVIEMRDNSDNTKLKLANGNITASGDISSSGIITANSFIGALTGTATGLSGTPDITVGTIEATSLNVTSITSSIVTSSIIQTEGSNIFGDGISDTQTFNGHITASGNISASGNIMGLNLSGTNTGDQDLSSYIQASQTGSFLTASNTGSLATIAQLNASSSALQTNIDASIQPSQTGSFIVASQTGSFLTSIPGGTLSSSAQIAPNISGAFTADSASFSTRVTANETITTKTLISGSSQVSFNSISGLPSGLLSSSDNFVITSSTASFAVTSSNVLFNQITSSGAVNIQGILSIPGFLNVSSSLAAAVAGGDNLGNHTATQDLNLNSNTIKGVANITASGNISASGQIIAEAGPTINITLASDTATNIDTFNTSSNNGAIYDYTLFSTPSGARAGQCMVIHHNGNTDFTDTSTPTLGSETSIPFFETSVNGSNVEVKITSGSGYTFKAFIKKL